MAAMWQRAGSSAGSKIGWGAGVVVTMQSARGSTCAASAAPVTRAASAGGSRARSCASAAGVRVTASIASSRG
jgi:hypothetical protein